MIKNPQKNLSMRMITLISFIIFLVSTVIIIGSITFSNWSYSVENQIKDLVAELNNDTNSQITNFINISEKMNEYHQQYIEYGILDIQDHEVRDKFFVSALQQSPEYVYSFSYGTIDGEYYGARRNLNNEIEIIRNNQDTNRQTWLYQITNEMTAGEVAEKVGFFDPRDEEWYQEAVSKNQHIFTPVYQHFTLKELTISASLPVYVDDQLQGVLGTHIKLSYINQFLKDITDNQSFVIIFERKTAELIANSLDIDNFLVGNDGSYVRTKISSIEEEMYNAFLEYQESNIDQYKIKSKGQSYYINIHNYSDTGLDWIFISGVPTRLYTQKITNSLIISLFITLLFVIASIVIYYVYSSNFLLKPLYTLITSTDKIAQGDFNQRIEYNRNDEFGQISQSFNKMTETISALFNDLENQVVQRTNSLSLSNQELKESKERLQLILDSTVEAIYGLDINGNCTFCNQSGLKILGYNKDEVIGKNMHYLIHHSTKDGEPIDFNDCRVFQALLKGIGVKVDDEVFWKKDGTSFNVEYNSYPQYKDGKLVGAVVTFVDITDRKKYEEKIRYLSYYDSLTGLYNRNAFREKLEEIDKEENYPLTIIFGDVNGLKLTNDIFGHTAGDNLLKTTAEILKRVLRKKDLLSRYAGDEFVIAMPNTSEIEAEKIVQMIKKEFSMEDTIAMMASISLGFETKSSTKENIIQIIDSAEAWMYKDKMDKRKTTNIETINKILTLLHKRCPAEKTHSLNVSLLCYDLAIAMGKSETEIRKCKDAGYFHDIGKIVVDQELLNYVGPLTGEQHKIMEQHTVVGYRILNLFDETLDLAEGVLYHHEKWNGSGYPKGLKGEEIPELARIIKIVENYDALVNRKKMNIDYVLSMIQKEAGVLYDPNIVEVFVKMIKDKSRYKTID